jgi:hypothetical protein
MDDRRGIALAACLVLALATIVAATSSGLEWRSSSTSVADRPTPGTPDPTTGGGTLPDELPTPADPTGDREQGSFRLTLTGVLSALLLLAAAVLAVAIAARLRLVMRRRRRRDDTGLRGPAGVPAEVEEPDVEELARVLGQQIEEIGLGAPRNAIVATWVALEQAAERAGVPRFPTDTSTDLAVRMLGSHVIERRPMDELAELYREARFSEHELTEQHRTSARACLERLRAQLDGAAR